MGGGLSDPHRKLQGIIGIKKNHILNALRLNYLHFHLQIYLHYRLQSIAAKLLIFKFFKYLMPIPHKIWSLMKKKKIEKKLKFQRARSLKR